MNLPNWATRIIAAWAGIGALLVAGIIPAPEWLLPYFSESLINGTKVFLGAVITYLSVIKGAKSISAGSEVKTMSGGDQIWYAINPFKV